MAGYGTGVNAFTNPAFSNANFGIKPLTPSYSFPSSTAVSTPTAFSPTTSLTPASTSMDPFSAVLGVGSIAASIFGGSQQQSAANRQAKAAERAAALQAQQAQEAAYTGARGQLAGELGGFGMDFKTALFESGAGAARQRRNQQIAAAQEARFIADNPDLATQRSLQRYEERLKAGMPGFVNLFA